MTSAAALMSDARELVHETRYALLILTSSFSRTGNGVATLTELGPATDGESEVRSRVRVLAYWAPSSGKTGFLKTCSRRSAVKRGC